MVCLVWVLSLGYLYFPLVLRNVHRRDRLGFLLIFSCHRMHRVILVSCLSLLGFDQLGRWASGRATSAVSSWVVSGVLGVTASHSSLVDTYISMAPVLPYLMAISLSLWLLFIISFPLSIILLFYSPYMGISYLTIIIIRSRPLGISLLVYSPYM